MARFLHRDLLPTFRKHATFFLAFFWLSGLVCGILFFLSASDIFVSLMRRALITPVSIVSLLSALVLPFLFSAFAVFLSEPKFLLLICFGKAFLFSLVSLSVMQAFGSAGWMIRCLLLFSDLLSLPVLYLFWQRYIFGNRKFNCWDLCGMLSLGLLIGSIDYCLVSPFLARLIEI